MYMGYKGKNEDCFRREEEGQREEREQKEWYDQGKRFKYKNIMKSIVSCAKIGNGVKRNKIHYIHAWND